MYSQYPYIYSLSLKNLPKKALFMTKCQKFLSRLSAVATLDRKQIVKSPDARWLLENNNEHLSTYPKVGDSRQDVKGFSCFSALSVWRGLILGIWAEKNRELQHSLKLERFRTVSVVASDFSMCLVCNRNYSITIAVYQQCVSPCLKEQTTVKILQSIDQKSDQN